MRAEKILRWGRALTVALAAVGILHGCAGAVIGGAAVGARLAHDRRTVGTTVEDKNVELKARHILYEQKQLRERSDISVDSYNLRLLLTGQARDPQLVQRFVEQAGRIERVRQVINEIKIEPEATLAEQGQDVYLTTTISMNLFDIEVPGFDVTRVKVVTERGVVYLMGLVTEQEANAVVNRVRYIAGVRKVVKVFEYIQPETGN